MHKWRSSVTRFQWQTGIAGRLWSRTRARKGVGAHKVRKKVLGATESH